MNYKLTIIQAISTVLALSLTGTSTVIAAQNINNKTTTNDMQAAEKCYGIVKAGQNDCETAHSSCAGSAKMDGQKDAWISLPKGLCDRIVGGTTQPPKKM